MITAAVRHLRWLLLIALALLGAAQVAAADETLVFAAASLKPALDAMIVRPPITAIGNIKVSYAASSQLARQIEAGAPAALFISADQDWMDYLQRKQLLVEGTRVNLLGNALVLIAPKDSSVKIALASGVDLSAALGRNGHLAMAEPNSVPAGKYAKSALLYLGAWNALKGHIVAADNVRAALNFVVRGEAQLGVVYRSDAVSESAVRIVATFPERSHAAIVYPAAIIAGHDSAAVHALLNELRGTAEQAILRDYGFDPASK